MERLNPPTKNNIDRNARVTNNFLHHWPNFATKTAEGVKSCWRSLAPQGSGKTALSYY